MGCVGNRVLFWKYSSILGASLINMCGRPRYFWGNMAIYVMSYVIIRGQGTGSGSAIQVSWLLLISTLCWSLGLCASDLMVTVVGPRVIVLLGIVCTTIFFIGSVFCASLSWMMYTIVFGVVIGTGLGLYEGTLLNHYVLDWVDTNKGLSTSVFITSSAIGSAIVNFFTTWWTNPRNLTPVLDASSGAQIFNQDEILDKVQTMFIILGVGMVTLQTIGFCMLKQKHSIVSTDESCEEGKESVEMESSDDEKTKYSNGSKRMPNNTTFEPDGMINSSAKNYDIDCDYPSQCVTTNGETRTETTAIISTKLVEDGTCYTPDSTPSDEDKQCTVVELVKSPQFQKLWFIYFCLTHTDVIVATDYKLFGQVWIADDHFLTNLGIAMSIAVTVFTFASGAIMDTISIKTTLTCECSLAAALSLAMYFTARINKWAYFVASLSAKVLAEFYYISFIFAMYTIFGKTNISRNIAMVSTASIVSAFVASAVAEVFVAHFGWFYVYGWAALLSTVSLVFVFFGKY